MLKKYLDGKIVEWETIEICPHPPPTDPSPGKAERSGEAKNWRRLSSQWPVMKNGIRKFVDKNRLASGLNGGQGWRSYRKKTYWTSNISGCRLLGLRLVKFPFWNLSKTHGQYEIIDFVKIDWPLYCMASDAGIKFNHFAHKLLTF